MDYRIKIGVEPLALLCAVDKCKNDVFFSSMTGDTLNLKSQLNRMVFLYLGKDSATVPEGSLKLLSEEDFLRLKPFLEA